MSTPAMISAIAPSAPQDSRNPWKASALITKPGGTGRPAAARRLRLAPFPPATAVDCAGASSKKRIASAKDLHEPRCAVQPDTLPGFDHLCGGSRADDRGNAELPGHD